MTEVRSLKELRSQSKAGKLSIIALLFLPLIGLLCLFWPEESAHYLPYVLGVVMILSGAGGIIVAITRQLKERNEALLRQPISKGKVVGTAAIATASAGGTADETASAKTAAIKTTPVKKAGESDRADERSRSVGTAIVMCVLGGVILAHGASSISFVGVMWGLLGLYKAGDEFDEIIHRIKTKRRFIVKLAFAVFELVLAVLLILHPFANIDHHIILLGLELITFPFKIDRSDDGRFTLEAEA